MREGKGDGGRKSDEDGIAGLVDGVSGDAKEAQDH